MWTTRRTIPTKRKERVLPFIFKRVDKTKTRSFLVDSTFGILQESNDGLASHFHEETLFLISWKEEVKPLFNTVSAEWLTKTTHSTDDIK